MLVAVPTSQWAPVRSGLTGGVAERLPPAEWPNGSPPAYRPRRAREGT